jgi:hypothetical protein
MQAQAIISLSGMLSQKSSGLSGTRTFPCFAQLDTTDGERTRHKGGG